MQRFARLACCLFVGTAWLLPPAVPAAGAQSLTLDATAGLAGLTRAGRWTPVRISVTNAGAERRGELTVTWGSHVLRRALVLTAPSRRQFEVFVRTADVEDRIRIAFADASGHDVAGTFEAPISVVGYEDPLVVCVGDSAAFPPSDEDAACTVRIDAADAPASPRGYDAADRVLVQPGVGLSADVRTAIATAAALRRLDENGDVAATRQLVRPLMPRGLLPAQRQALWLLAGAAAVLLLALSLVQRRVREPLWILAAAATVLVATTTIAARVAGRVGPGRSITVRHDSLIQQPPGAVGALVTSRAIVVFPSWRAVDLRVEPANGAVLHESATSPGQVEQRLDDTGTPALSGTYGFGARQVVEYEGTTDAQVLDVTWSDGRVVVRNVSTATLEACRFAEGLGPPREWQLPPGALAEVAAERWFPGPVFSCTMTGAPVVMSDEHAPVVFEGVTRVVAYADRPTADGPADGSSDRTAVLTDPEVGR